MEEQLKDGKAEAPSQKPSIDPLRRVWIPEEKRNVNGLFEFQTQDKQKYIRIGNGSIRNAHPKVNGKQARRLRARRRAAGSVKSS